MNYYLIASAYLFQLMKVFLLCIKVKLSNFEQRVETLFCTNLLFKGNIVRRHAIMSFFPHKKTELCVVIL